MFSTLLAHEAYLDKDQLEFQAQNARPRS